jgi:hypothetical protein
VNSYVELEISKLKKQIADVEREVAVVKGQADAESSKLVAVQTAGASAELLKLEAAEAAIEKWDGRLPMLNPKPGQTVVITQQLLNQLSGER